jgi:hypothetical protein
VFAITYLRQTVNENARAISAEDVLAQAGHFMLNRESICHKNDVRQRTDDCENLYYPVHNRLLKPVFEVSPLEPAMPLPYPTSSSLPSDRKTSTARQRWLDTQWGELYAKAVLEPEYGLLPEKIALARNAIFDRAEELFKQPVTDEQRALNDALRILRLLENVAAKESSTGEAA